MSMNAPQGDVIGVRTWEVQRDKRGYVLGSFGKQVTWDTPVQHASCLAGGTGKGHSAPARACTCGLWAAWADKPERFNETNIISGDTGRLLGEVIAFGKIVPGEIGMRAQSMMVRSFTEPNCPCGRAALYAVFKDGRVSTWACDTCKPKGVTVRATAIAGVPDARKGIPSGWQYFNGVKFGSRCAHHGCRLKVYAYCAVGRRFGYCQAHIADAWAREKTYASAGTHIEMAADVLRALRIRYDVPRFLTDDAYYATAV